MSLSLLLGNPANLTRIYNYLVIVFQILLDILFKGCSFIDKRQMSNLSQAYGSQGDAQANLNPVNPAAQGQPFNSPPSIVPYGGNANAQHPSSNRRGPNSKKPPPSRAKYPAANYQGCQASQGSNYENSNLGADPQPMQNMGPNGTYPKNSASPSGPPSVQIGYNLPEPQMNRNNYIDQGLQNIENGGSANGGSINVQDGNNQFGGSGSDSLVQGPYPQGPGLQQNRGPGQFNTNDEFKNDDRNDQARYVNQSSGSGSRGRYPNQENYNGHPYVHQPRNQGDRQSAEGADGYFQYQGHDQVQKRNSKRMENQVQHPEYGGNQHQQRYPRQHPQNQYHEQPLDGYRQYQERQAADQQYYSQQHHQTANNRSSMPAGGPNTRNSAGRGGKRGGYGGQHGPNQHQPGPNNFPSPNKKGNTRGKQNNMEGTFLLFPGGNPVQAPEGQYEEEESPFKPERGSNEIDVPLRKYNSTVYDNVPTNNNASSNNNGQEDPYAVRKSNSMMHQYGSKVNQRPGGSPGKADSNNMYHAGGAQDEKLSIKLHDTPYTQEGQSSVSYNSQYQGGQSMNSHSTGELPPVSHSSIQYQPTQPTNINNPGRQSNPKPYHGQMSHSHQIRTNQKFDRNSSFSQSQQEDAYSYHGRPSGGPYSQSHKVHQPGGYNDQRNWNQGQVRSHHSNYTHRNDRNSLPSEYHHGSGGHNPHWHGSTSGTYHQGASGRISNAGPQGSEAINQANYYFDTYSVGLDTLYREPQDGMISLRKNAAEEVGNALKEIGANAYQITIPEIELITQIDLSTLWEEKQQFAGKIAEDLYRLNHPNLLNITRPIKYLDSHIKNGFLEICSECPDHISSWKSFCKRPFNLYQIVSIFRQLAAGISHMHDQGLIFRDVHPTRIHMSGDLIKLNLIGMPYNFKKLLKNQSFSGHLNYSAPEILENGPDNFLNPKVDVWSLGCCLYYLVTKRDPFDGKDPFQIKQNIRQGRLDRYQQHFGKDNYGNDRHPIVQKLLQNCLNPNHGKRPASRQLIDCIDSLIAKNIELFRKLDQEEISKAESRQAMHNSQGPVSIQSGESLISGQNQQNSSNIQYPNKIMNKHIPEFFIKHSNSEPIHVKLLPLDEIVQRFNIGHPYMHQQNQSFKSMGHSPGLSSSKAREIKFQGGHVQIEQLSIEEAQSADLMKKQTSNLLRIPDFNSIGQGPQQQQQSTSSQQSHDQENSWRLPQSDSTGASLALNSKSTEIGDKAEIPVKAQGHGHDEVNNTPSFRNQNEEKQFIPGQNVYKDHQNGDFAVMFQDSTISEEKNRKKFQDELDDILMNPNETLSPTLPGGLGDQPSPDGGSGSQKDANNAPNNQTVENSSYSSSAYRVSIFKDSKLVYNKKSKPNKQDHNSDHKKELQGNTQNEGNQNGNECIFSPSRTENKNDSQADEDQQPQSDNDNQRGEVDDGNSGELEEFNPENDDEDDDEVESTENNIKTTDIKNLTKDLLQQTRGTSGSGVIENPKTLQQTNTVISDAPNISGNDEDFEYNRQKSAPTDCYGMAPSINEGQSNPRNMKKQAPTGIPRGSQSSQKSWSSNSGLSKRIQRQINDQDYQQQSPSADFEQNAEAQNESDSRTDQNQTSEMLAKLWNDQQPKQLHMPIPQDNNDYIHSSSMGSGNTLMNQEMIDLVDNLIDTSPKTRGEIYDKAQFSLKILRTQDQKKDASKDSPSKTDEKNDDPGDNSEISEALLGASNKVYSVGFLQYESGDIYEGKFMNGKRSGQGKMIFANGDKYTGKWNHDQMCDSNGIYQFKNGNEYVGSFKACSKIVSRKYGCFGGQGQLKIAGKGTYTGSFANHCVSGSGKFESLDGQIVVEKAWNQMSIEDFIDLIDKVVESQKQEND